MMKLSMENKYQNEENKTTLSWSISILSYKTHIKVQVKYPQILKFLTERLRLSNKSFSGTSSLQNKRRGILNFRQQIKELRLSNAFKWRDSYETYSKLTGRRLHGFDSAWPPLFGTVVDLS